MKLIKPFIFLCVISIGWLPVVGFSKDKTNKPVQKTVDPADELKLYQGFQQELRAAEAKLARLKANENKLDKTTQMSDEEKASLLKEIKSDVTRVRGDVLRRRDSKELTSQHVNQLRSTLDNIYELVAVQKGKTGGDSGSDKKESKEPKEPRPPPSPVVESVSTNEVPPVNGSVTSTETTNIPPEKIDEKKEETPKPE